MLLLGARSLEGLNLRVEPVVKKLVDAGPAPAAASCAPSQRFVPNSTPNVTRARLQPTL